MKLKSARQGESEKRFHVEGYGEVSLNASVWEDLQAQVVWGEIDKMRVGQSAPMRFQGSHCVGKSRVRRVK